MDSLCDPAALATVTKGIRLRVTDSDADKPLAKKQKNLQAQAAPPPKLALLMEIAEAAAAEDIEMVEP